MAENPRVTPVTKTASAPPHRPLHIQRQCIDRPNAFVQDYPSETYDVAVLIALPISHPRDADRLTELGEYAIGMIKLAATTSLEGSVRRDA